MKVTPEYNLGKLHPDLVGDWHPTKNGDLKPDQIAPRSNKKVWWSCDLGHEWEAKVCDRAGGNGCPKCYQTNRVAIYLKGCLKRRGSLADRYPDLAREWHPTKNLKLKPSDVMSGSLKKVWWICSQGHEWKATVANRKRGSGCPKCYNERRRKRSKE